MKNNKSYQTLVTMDSFDDRFNYLKMNGHVGDQTFGGHRYLNQRFYNSQEWRSVRRDVILRDNGCDLAHPDHPIFGQIFIHHINPVAIDDLINRTEKVCDPDNLVCVSFQTHNAIHYGDASFSTFIRDIERKKNDTCPWR